MNDDGAVRSAAWRQVAWSMGIGAAYDAAFGLAILFFADRAAAWMRLPLPEDRTFLGLNGVFLLLLAGLYALPAREPERYRGVVAVAAAGRLAGFGYLGHVWWGGQATVFAWLAAGDLAFAMAHAILLAVAVGGTQVSDRQGT